MRLLELQKNFISSITDKDSSAIETMLENTGISSGELIDVYRNNFVGGIISALRITYPVTEKLVGADFFRATCLKFIKKYVPESGNLDDYGAGFSSFLKEFPPAKSLPYLPDVAKLEWLFHKSAFAPEISGMCRSEFAKILPEKYFSLVFGFSPHVNLMKSPFPVHTIWEMNQKEVDENDKLDISAAGKAHLLMARKHLKTDIISLPSEEFIFLEAMKSGKSLFEAYEEAAKINEEFDLASVLEKSFSLGIFSSFSIN